MSASVNSVRVGLKSTKRGQLLYSDQRNNGQLSKKEFVGHHITRLSDEFSYLKIQEEDNSQLQQSKASKCDSLIGSHHLNPVSATVHKVQQSHSDSKVVDNHVSSIQHYVETELKLLAQCGDAKYKETLKKKREQFERHDDVLVHQSEQRRELMWMTLSQAGEKNVQFIRAIEQKHSEDAKQKQNQLYRTHKQSAKDQVARIEREKERIQSLQDDKRRQVIASLSSLHEHIMSCSVQLDTLMSSCRYPRLLSASATACHTLMNEVTGKAAGVLLNAQHGDASDEEISKVSALAQEAKKIVASMEVHVANANRCGDEETARVASASRDQQQQHAEDLRSPAGSVTSGASVTETVTGRPTGSKHTSASSAQTSSNNNVPSCQSTAAAAAAAAATGGRSSVPMLLPNVPDDVISWYHSLQSLLQQVMSSCESFTKDPRCNKDRFDLQKAINTPINGISQSNASQVSEKLCRVLAGHSVDIGSNRQVSARKHEAGVTFCKQLFAKKIVKQGEEQVSSNHDSAFLIAGIAVNVWSEFPDVGELILGYFHQMCPYLIPYYLPLRDNQGSQEDYFRSLGYLIEENGQVEQQDKFLRRMSGFVRLYAAITVTSPTVASRRSHVSTVHPHGVEYAWKWFARIANVEPRPDITAAVIGDFLSVAGHALYRAYGRQFVKLVELLAGDYLSKIKAVTRAGSGGPVTRLEGLLRDAVAGRYPRPPRM